MITDASSSSTLVQQSEDLGSQSLKFVPNGVLGISETTATANEEGQAQASSSTSTLIESLTICSQHTYFDSIASKGLSFVRNGLLSSHKLTPDIGQFVHFITLLLS